MMQTNPIVVPPRAFGTQLTNLNMPVPSAKEICTRSSVAIKLRENPQEVQPYADQIFSYIISKEKNNQLYM